MLVRFCFIVLLFFYQHLAISQSEISVCKTKLEDDAIALELRLEYADTLLLHYRRSNPDSAVFYSRILLNIAKQLKDTASVDYGHMHLGSLKRIQGEYDSSVFFYNLALNSYKLRNFEEGIASVYNNLATVYKTQSRYDLAIKNYHEALTVFKKSDNYNALANLYSSFAGLYFKLENFEKAFDYWQKAADFYMLNSSAEISHCYRGHARILIIREDYATAEKIIDKALKLDVENQIKVFEVENYLLQMNLFNELSDQKKFLFAKKNAEVLINAINNPLNHAAYFEEVGTFHLKNKDFALASQFLDSAMVKIENEDLPELKLRLLKKKIEASLGMNKIIEASDLFNQITILEEKVSTIRRDRITQEMYAEYELQDKEELIQLLEEKKQTAEKLVEQERQINEIGKQQILLLWIGLILFLAFLIYAILANRKLKKTQLELKHSIEQKEFLFRELNHRVKNNLHIVNSFLGIEMHGRSEEVQSILKVCESRIHSLGLMHEMLYQGELTGNVDLKEYTLKLVKFINDTLADQNTQMQVNVKDNINLTASKIVLVGLILNELITNAIKYAKRENEVLDIIIATEINKDVLNISVKDNGKGMPEDYNPQKSTSLGLKMAFGLTRQLGGEFQFKRPERGSEFLFSLKLT